MVLHKTEKTEKYEPGTRGIYGIGLNTIAPTRALINSYSSQHPHQHASTGINSSLENITGTSTVLVQFHNKLIVSFQTLNHNHRYRLTHQVLADSEKSTTQ